MNYYQIKMALKFLDQYSVAVADSKDKIALKFKKHAGNIDTAFKEANLETDLENVKSQLQTIVKPSLPSWDSERSHARLKRMTTRRGVLNCSASLWTNATTTQCLWIRKCSKNRSKTY